MAPLGSDFLCLTTTEDPGGSEQAKVLAAGRSDRPNCDEEQTGGSSFSVWNPGLKERGMTSSLEGSAKEIQVGDDSTGIAGVEEETDRGVSVLGKPSKLPIESSSPNSLYIELEKDSSSPD